jgi:hypothetical protein
MIALNDRRHGHWHDQAEANAAFFHPDAERSRLMGQLDEWLAALMAEAPSADTVPQDETAFWKEMT